MRYANIEKFEVANGVGTGMSLFVQGCHFHCKDCFNTETWDFSGGREWTSETEDYFLRLTTREYISRITILGGEPLADENVETVCLLVEKIRAKCPNKQIWLYTGYTWETIHPGVLIKGIDYNSYISNCRSKIICNCDVIVDGKFDYSKKDLTLPYRGSSNQRIIDVKKSILQNEVILWQ